MMLQKDKLPEIRGAHAPGVLVSAPRRNLFTWDGRLTRGIKIRDREGAIVSTRRRMRSPEDCPPPVLV